MSLDKETFELWDKIFKAEFIEEPGCYKTCESYCCRWNTPDIPLTIIPKGGTLFYLPNEFQYIEKYGKITDKPLYDISIKLDNGKEIKVYYKYCTDDKNCNVLFSRSLYCKLYPFFPVMNIKGEIVDVKYISIYDITCQLIDQKTPCYVKDKKEHYLELWKNNSKNIELLKNPNILFYLMVANIVHDNYCETLKNSPIINLKGTQFWKKWEKFYLGKMLFNKNKIKEDLENLYSEFEKHYTDFL